MLRLGAFSNNGPVVTTESFENKQDASGVTEGCEPNSATLHRLGCRLRVVARPFSIQRSKTSSTIGTPQTQYREPVTMKKRCSLQRR